RAEQTAVAPAEIMARKQRLVGEFAAYRQRQLECAPFDFLRGRGSFAGPHALEITDDNGSQTIHSKSFPIATGSKYTRIPIPGLAETGFRDSDEALDSPDLPGSVIVLGAGPTGLELAHYYAGLGSRVTIVQRSSQVLKETDADVAGALTDALRKRGIE